MSQHTTKCHCGKERRKLWHLVCENCWKQLPGELQSEVYHAYKTDNGGPSHRAAVRRVFEFLKAQKAKPEAPASEKSLHEVTVTICDLPGGKISMECKCTPEPEEGMLYSEASPAQQTAFHVVRLAGAHLKNKEVA
jgi:hypothetical protein